MVSIFEEASCSVVLYTPDLESKTAALVSTLLNVQRLVVPGLQELLKGTHPHYPYSKTWSEARTDPIIVAHSSGSTGESKEFCSRLLH